MLRTLVVLAAIAAATSTAPEVRAAPGRASAAPEPGAGPVLQELGFHTTRAEITVDAPPERVYEVVTSYAEWTRLLGDVKSVSVVSGGRDNARVRFESRALKRRVTVVFDNVPGKLVRFKLVEGPRGAKAHGTYEARPVDGGKRTRITATFYMDVGGVAGMFVSDGELRELRRRKLKAELQDLQRHFRETASAAR